METVDRGGARRRRWRSGLEYVRPAVLLDDVGDPGADVRLGVRHGIYGVCKPLAAKLRHAAIAH